MGEVEIPTLRRNQDISVWLRTFVMVIEDRKVPIERVTFNLLMCLDQDIFMISELLGVNEQTDLKALSTLLKNNLAHQPSSMLSQKECNERVQLSNESITGFWESVVGLSFLAYRELESFPREKIAKNRFVKGLRSAYVKRSLISFSSDKNIAHLLTQALELEAAERSTPESVKIDREVSAIKRASNNRPDNFDVFIEENCISRDE